MRKNYKQIIEQRLAKLNAITGLQFRVVKGQTGEAVYAVVLEGRGAISDYLPADKLEQFLLGMQVLSAITLH